MPAPRDANQKRLLDFFVDMDEYELDSALRSVGSRTTPPGWRKYKLATKRLSLNELLSELSDERLRQLAEAYAADLGEPPTQSDEGSSVPSVFEARQVRRRGMPSVGDLISSGAAGSTDGLPGFSADAEEAPTPSDGEGQDEGSIFVVHGRDHDAMNRAARVLERTTRRDVTVLHEQANSGRTLLEKFEGHASTAAYAVVLLTGDDIGGAREQAGAGVEGLQRRARQNVIFELGFFCAALGRGRVAVLLGEGVEKPSDLDGLVYIALDAAGAWRAALCREVQAAGIAVDFARIP